jgi:pyrimidine operon attenuation protein/uracil phosphoribosyltransferase
VFGWVEPQTKIVVNGRELPVASDGLFMENISLSPDNTIVVEAENKKGKKTVVRSFEVLY